MARRRAGLFEAPSNVVSTGTLPSGVPDTSFVWRELRDQAQNIRRRLQPALNQFAESQARGDFEAGRVHQRFVWGEQDAAYNNAMLQSWAARATVDVSARAMELEAEHGDNVEAFDAAFEGVREGFISEAPPAMAMHMGALLDREHAETRQRIGERRRNAAIQQVGADAEALLTHMEAQLSGYTDLTSPEYQSRAAEYREQIQALTANPLSGLSPEEGRFRFDNTISRHQARAFQDAGLRIYDDGGRNAESADLAIEAARGLIYDPALTLSEAQREGAFGDVRRAIAAEESERIRGEREMRAELREYRSERSDHVRDLLDDFGNRNEDFVEIPDAELNAMADAVGETANAGLARRVNARTIEQAALRQLRGRSLVEIEAQVDAWRAMAAEGGERAGDATVAMQYGESYLQHLRTGDVLSRSQAHFGERLPDLSQGLGPRIRYAERRAGDLGAAAPSYLTRTERAAAAGVARAGGEQAMQLAESIVGDAVAAGDGQELARADAILGEIANENGAEALGAIGRTLLIGGRASEQTARWIADAQRLRATEGYRPPTVPGVEADDRAEIVRGVLGSRNAGLSAEEAAALGSTVDMVWEGMAASNPANFSTRPNFNRSYAVAANAALGGVTRRVGDRTQVFGGVAPLRGGERVAIPNWLRRDQFDNVRRSLTVRDYRDASFALPGLEPSVPLSELRDARMVPVGVPGQYYLLDDDGAAIAIAPGVAYILDFNLIRDRLAERRPDAVVR